VPLKDTIVILNAKSTRDDATLTRKACLNNHFRSLIVVTEPFHTRRSHLVFSKTYRDTGIRVMVCPVENSLYRYDDWWVSEQSFLTVYEEYLKTAYYLAKGYL
jgi:uncharacterized SAM-binding protein YcdF (DUF218 family)